MAGAAFVAVAALFAVNEMFQLAVEYMMDADGLGKTPQDARDLFLDMAEGADFATAFENRMGMPLRDYEEQFFELAPTLRSGWSRSIPVSRMPTWIPE